MNLPPFYQNRAAAKRHLEKSQVKITFLLPLGRVAKMGLSDRNLEGLSINVTERYVDLHTLEVKMMLCNWRNFRLGVPVTF